MTITKAEVRELFDTAKIAELQYDKFPKSAEGETDTEIFERDLKRRELLKTFCRAEKKYQDAADEFTNAQ